MTDSPTKQPTEIAGRYTILRLLGRGGTATVYLAHDRLHDREVAIKILLPELASSVGADRFLREIHLTAGLQHPHILSVLDAGSDDGQLYVVLPFMTGGTLREHIQKERQLPIEEAVELGRAIASALDYAHSQGLVHRDVKPENILLSSGIACLGDFGIARALDQILGEGTSTGMVRGTAAYMSPEQASADKHIDGRSDVYSLGCVLYEALAGVSAFVGATPQSVMSQRLVYTPREVRAYRPAVPFELQAVIDRALKTNPADRFATAREFGDALGASIGQSGRTHETGAPAIVADGPWPARRRRGMIVAGAVLGGLVLVAAGLFVRNGQGPSTTTKWVVQYNMALDSDEAIVPGGSWWDRFALSRDGSHLAYIGGPHAQLLIRPRDKLRAIAVTGSERARTPFFSPDGQHVGFLTEGHVQITSINGGPAVTVTDSQIGVAGASWGRDGFIYVDAQGERPLARIEAKPGAVATRFTALDTASGEYDHAWPDVLPNGKGVLFTIWFRGKHGAKDLATPAVGVADIASGKHRVLLRGAMHARYAASGHLLYVTKNRTLMVVPFDQNSMKLVGDAMPLIQDMRAGALGAADVAVSEPGTLMYATGARPGKQELVWVTREGKARSVDPDWQGQFEHPALSPDGARLAVTIIGDEGTSDIWTKPLTGGRSTKLTFAGTDNSFPAWTPDGRSVTFTSNAAPAGSLDLWTKPADGSAQAVLQLHEKHGVFEARWSADRRWLIYATQIEGPTNGDIFGIRPGIDTAPVPLVATNVVEMSPDLSPDGRWLAYTSYESQRPEIYVVPFPNTGATKWAVSTGGGTMPRWSHRGNELFYGDPSGYLVAVEVKTNPTFSLGRSTRLFPTAGFRSSETGPAYAVSPDDQRFLMIRPVPGTPPERLTVIDNWFEDIKGKSRTATR